MAGPCILCAHRWVEDTFGFVSATVGELVPAEAQAHLWNAQREVLLALAATIEHHAHHRGSAPAQRSPETRRPSRITID